MTELLWKATRADGTSRGGLRWKVGQVTMHPLYGPASKDPMVRNDPATYLSFSTEPAETLIGIDWDPANPPCLFRVEPIGDVIDNDQYPHKRCALAARTVSQEPSWMALGPNGEQVARYLDELTHTTPEQWANAGTAWDAAWTAGAAVRAAARGAARGAVRAAVRVAARVAAWRAVRVAVRGAAGDAARDAAEALVTRDLITPDQFRTLAEPMLSALGWEL